MLFLLPRLLAFVSLLLLAESSGSAVGSGEIPVRMAGGLMWTETEIEGSRASFVFDTGAEESVLGLRFAREAGLRLVSEERVRGVGGISQAFRAAPATMKIGGVELTKSFLVLDLRAASKGCRRRIDGLVGADVLRGRVTTIDFARSSVVFGAPGAPRSPGNTPYRESVLPLRMSTGGPCVVAEVGDRDSAWLRLDSGCTGHLEISQYVRQEERPPATSVGIGVRDETARVRLLPVSLGEFYFGRIEVVHTRSAPFPGEAGLIGMPLLSSFDRIVIDSVAGIVIFGAAG